MVSFLMDLGTKDYAGIWIPMMEFRIMNQMSLTIFSAAANSFVMDEDSEAWLDSLRRNSVVKCIVTACW